MARRPGKVPSKVRKAATSYRGRSGVNRVRGKQTRALPARRRASGGTTH